MMKSGMALAAARVAVTLGSVERSKAVALARFARAAAVSSRKYILPLMAALAPW
jgi:hypothetical protein